MTRAGLEAVGGGFRMRSAATRITHHLDLERSLS
jgi:hypothetical protein